jgi:hypothetical protein
MCGAVGAQVKYTLDSYRLYKWLREQKLVAKLPGSLKLGTLYKHITNTPLDNAHDAAADVRANVVLLKWEQATPHLLKRLMLWESVVEYERRRLDLRRAARVQARRQFFDASDAEDEDVEECIWDADAIIDRDEVDDWEVVDQNPCPRPAFNIMPGLRSRRTQADDYKSPYSSFKKLWCAGTDGRWETSVEALLVRETNRYAKQHQAYDVIKRFLSWFVHLHNRAPGEPMRYAFEPVRTSVNTWKWADLRKKPRPWKPVTKHEMRAFMCHVLVHAVDKARNDVTSLWFAEPPPHLGFSTYSKFVSKTRFHQIWRYLHLSDVQHQPPANSDGDRLYKVREFMNLAQRQWRHSYECGRFVSIDEAMINFKGRCRFATVMAKKHHDQGLKAWVATDSKTYFVEAVDYKTRDWDDRQTGLYEGTGVAMKLLEEADLLQANRVVVCDNFYTSVQLFSALRSKKTYGLGVLRESRAPGGVKFNERDHHRGFSRTTYSRSANMAVTAWKDNRVVFFLTTIGPDDDEDGDGAVRQVLRWDKLQRKRDFFDCPCIVAVYNIFMNGVDVTDQSIEYVSLASVVKLKKWWMRIFFHHADLTLHNARVLHRLRTGENLSNREFREEVLRGAYAELNLWYNNAHQETVKSTKCQVVKTDQWMNNGRAPDGSARLTRKRAICLVCATVPALTTSAKRTIDMCAACGPMHASCYELFHRDPGFYQSRAEARARRQPQHLRTRSAVTSAVSPSGGAREATAFAGPTLTPNPRPRQRRRTVRTV